MTTKPVGLGIIHKILIVFVAINIIGDIGNVAFWWVNSASRGSLTSGALSFALGSKNALNIASIVLVVVAVIYSLALFGLLKKKKWAHQLIIAVTVVNRALALVLYQISPAFTFWAVWSIILIVVSYFDWRKINAATPPTQ
jgi:hypothetical protein